MTYRTLCATGSTVVAVILGTIVYGTRPLLLSARFDAEVIDLGSVVEGRVAHYRFGFTNRGLVPATVVDLPLVCGVWVDTLSDRSVAPGQRGEIDVRLDTAGFEGLLEKSLPITLKDPFQRSITLTVRVRVEREFELSERLVDFGVVTRDASEPRYIQIKPLNGLHIKSSA